MTLKKREAYRCSCRVNQRIPRVESYALEHAKRSGYQIISSKTGRSFRGKGPMLQKLSEEWRVGGKKAEWIFPRSAK